MKTIHLFYISVSSHSPIITYEVAVDRANEKGVFVAREMLSTLHHSLSHRKSWWYFHKRGEKPFFRFQILSSEGRIRFFFSTSSAYASFLTSQLYAHYPDIELKESSDILLSDQVLAVRKVKLAHHDASTLKLYVNMKDRTEKDSIDPLSSLTSALVKIPKGHMGGIIVDFSPIDDDIWRTEKKKSILSSHFIPHFLKSYLLHHWGYVAWIFAPLGLLVKFFHLLTKNPQNTEHLETKKHDEKSGKDELKTEAYGYGVNISIFKNAVEEMHDGVFLNELGGSMNIFANPQGNSFKIGKTKKLRYIDIHRHVGHHASILNTTELAGIVHLPTLYVKTPGVNWVMSRKFEVPHNLPNMENPNTPIGVANFRGNTEGFGIKPIDRARHVYIIGKTGMGKSTLLENMIYTDILNGRGVSVIDPHGDLVETILANIPKSRTNDIVLFDPADQDFPIGFNMLDNPNPELRLIVAGGLVSIFKKMFAESWGPRLEYILRNTILTLLQVPDTTLISIPMILTHESYRNQIVSKIKDPILVQFWTQEFGKMTPANMTEAVSPILNKVGQFLSSPILRNILGQPKNPFSLRWIMDNQKIFLVNLSKGRIGEDASALLGSMMVTKFQIEAMTRADIPESERKDFGLYVDEFQNFATDSFATILSEARKYKLSLTMANQYIAQMPETVQDAVFGNVGSLVSFQVGHHDATTLSEVLGGEDVITPQDMTNLRKYDIYTKLLIDGMPSPVFSATTYAPLHERLDVPPQQSRDVLLKVSREKYTKKKDFVEKRIFEYAKKITDDEKQYKKDQEAYKEKMKAKASEERQKNMQTKESSDKK